jgi:hypothetical protein
VQRTEILIEKSQHVEYKGAAHRNIDKNASSSQSKGSPAENINLIFKEKPSNKSINASPIQPYLIRAP